jgi:methyltransferase-like protein/SAM-dependent methyltransferase
LTDSLLASYEAVPYNSRPVGASEIGALEAVALLHGVTAPPADHARVLEVGCASGGNLIPMAYRYPHATFVGIDLAPTQIGLGNADVEALGLRNITLRAMSIADVTDDFGTFDYILCHGVYSWVPPDVQEAILRVASRNLARNGLAYISYNTLPGWHVRGMVREMVMYHDDHTLSPQERVSRAKAFVQLLSEQGGTKTTIHRLSLMEEVANLETQDDSYFLHEQLEPFNAPVYLSEFVRRAAAAGLRYMSEAKLADVATVPGEWAKRAAGEDPVRMQQYADFATGRTFRRSLLCHADVALSPEPGVDGIGALYVTLRAEPATPDDADRLKGGDVESFALASGPRITTNNPLVLAALHVLLRRAPEALSYPELLQRVHDRLSVMDPPDAPETADRAGGLAQAMLQCAVGGFVELNRYPSAFTRAVSERPVASAIARRKAASFDVVPNLRHVMVELSDVERAIIGDLDGTRDRVELAARMVERMNRGDLEGEGGVPTPSDIAAYVDAALARLGASALLEA